MISTKLRTDLHTYHPRLPFFLASFLVSCSYLTENAEARTPLSSRVVRSIDLAACLESSVFGAEECAAERSVDHQLV